MLILFFAKNRALLLLMALFFSVCSIYGQGIEISEKIDLGRESKVKLIGKLDSIILVYQEGGSRHFISAFAPNLKEKWKVKLNYPKKSVSILDIILDEKKVAIFYSSNQKGRSIIRVKQLDIDGQELSDQEIGAFHGYFSHADWKLISSENKQKILIYYIKSADQLLWMVYDRKTKTKIWKKKQDFKNRRYLQNFNQIVLTNKGKAFLVVEENNSWVKRKKHQFVVLTIDSRGDTDTSTVNFFDYLTSGVLFSYDEMNQQLVGAGFYTAKTWNVKGLFYIRISSKDGSLLQHAVFDPVLIRSLTGHKRENLPGLYDLEIQDLILRRDGGLICIGEQRSEHESSPINNRFYDNNMLSTQTDYTYENILVASIHPSGDLHWAKALHKSQHSENDNGRYSSYFLMKTTNNFRLLYNDNIRWNTNIYEYVVDGRGESKHHRIFFKEKLKLLPHFQDAIQLTANSLLVLNIRSNKMRLIKVSY